MKKIFIIISIICFCGVSYAHNGTNTIEKTSVNVSSNFEPGEMVYIEIPGLNADKALQLKNQLTSADIGAEWLGYCLSYDAICIKIPAAGQEFLENKLKHSTGGFTILAPTQVEYSLSNTCFNND